MNIHTFTTPKSKNMVKALAAATVLSLMLGGCTVHQPSYGSTQFRNKITVAETVERMELYVQPTGLNLSSRDQSAMANFIAQYARFGEGPLYINVPDSALNGRGIDQAKEMIAQYLSGVGRNYNAMQTGHYRANPSAPAPVVVSYRRLTTEPIDCHMGAPLTHTANNQPHSNFGCAQTANLAAMIDNPRQLLAPYALADAPSTHGVNVIRKMNEGELTSSPTPTQQKISATSGSSGGGE
ncbi:MAG: hypothetical protein COA43_06245 [Robiginitomaculum sp.]|nr:MAG: hypothetical protein COA43_06245 [Robiginitomaculum sp.]